MAARAWRRRSPSLIVALIALFVALGGPAQTARLITGRQIKDHSITTRDLSRGTVNNLRATTAGSVGVRQLRPGAVTTAAIAAGAVGREQLGLGAVGPQRLADSSVSGSKIADGTLQTVDVGSFTGAVTVDFTPFQPGSCQVASVNPTPADPAASPPPVIADDLVLASPSVGWPDPIVVTGNPGANNTLRIEACYVGRSTDPAIDPPATVFRYLTIDSP
jgi:hypothetical protein